MTLKECDQVGKMMIAEGRKKGVQGPKGMLFSMTETPSFVQAERKQPVEQESSDSWEREMQTG